MLIIKLIAPPCSNAPEIVPPLGLLSIAAYIEEHTREEVDIEVHDCSGAALDDRTLLDRIFNERVDLVGIPIYSEHVDIAVEWVRYIQKVAPAAILVAGGPHVTLSKELFIRNWGDTFHFSIAGDGEKAFMNLSEAIARGEDPSRSSIAGLSYLNKGMPVYRGKTATLQSREWPNPFRSRLFTQGKDEPRFVDPVSGKHRKAVTLVNSRSCPMRCSFCAIIAMSDQWTAAEPDDVINWLKYRYVEEPFEHIYFLDANFFVRPALVLELSRKIKENFSDVTWSALSTVLMFLKMRKDMDLLIENGLRMVELGIESGCQRQLDIMKKDCIVAKNHEAVRLIQDKGLRMGLDYIMFYPEQTVHDLRDNLLFLRDSGLVTQLDDLDHYFNALLLYPGTPLRIKYAEMFGIGFHEDEVPNPEGLFLDPNIREIYRLTNQFKRRHLGWIKTGLDKLTQLAAIIQTDWPELAQKYRLDAITLRHLPFKVIWSLTLDPDHVTIEEAFPELKSMKAGLQQISEQLEEYNLSMK